MYNKARKAFIPAAIACIGVEHAPGALPCQAGVSLTKTCSPYDIKFISTNPEDIKSKKESKLYSRSSTHETNKPKIDTVSKKDTTKTAIVNTNAQTTKSLEAQTSRREPITSSSSTTQKSKSLNSPLHNPTAKDNSEHINTQNKKTTTKVITKAKDIKVPTVKSKKEEAKKNISTKNNKKINNYTYVISKGDTLAKLALKFNTSVSTLLSMNNLKESDSIKVGQKILIPKNNLKPLKRKSYNSIYIVEKGDTLAKIAKITGVSVSRLIKYNNLEANTIKIGQKLYLKSNNIKKNQKITKNKKRIKTTRQLRVTATAYTSHPGQTDKTPFLAAWNNRIRPGMKIIAVSRDLIKKYGLTNGVKVRLKGLPGYYVVRDKMNKRFRNKIDIYMGTNKRKALKWGKRKIVLMW